VHYRENEVDEAHPLMMMFNQIKEYGAKIQDNQYSANFGKKTFFPPS